MNTFFDEIMDVFYRLRDGEINVEKAHKELCLLGHKLQRMKKNKELPKNEIWKLQKELWWSFRGLEED